MAIKLPSLSLLLQAFLGVIARFPSTMVCAAAGVGALMIVFERNAGEDTDSLVKTWMMAQIGLALCTGLTVWAESRSWAGWRIWALQALGLLALGGYYFLFDLDAPALEIVDLPRYLGLLAVAHLLVAAAPYFNRLPVADFWEYNKQLFANFVVGAVYTIILFSGLSLALLAVNELFNLGIQDKMYAHLFALLAGIFQTAFFLHHLPLAFAFSDRERAYNVVFRNLCQYILIPIVGLYFLILYAYSIKILVTWSLPHGWVSSLVLGFSVAGIFTYLINYLLPEYSGSKIVQAYRKWFWWVLLPMVGLLFVAIGRRIADYGITEARFYVAHAGVWLLAMCAYFLKSKTDNIKFIPVSLALFILVAVLGPFTAFRVARLNQTDVLRALLEKNGCFDGGTLRPAAKPAPAEDAKRIRSCLTFLERRDALGHIAPWFPLPLDSIAPDPGKPYAFTRANALADWLQVLPESETAFVQRLVSVYPRQPQPLAGNIAGYRMFYRLELYNQILPGHNAPLARFSDSRKFLLLLHTAGKIPVDSFDLTPLMRQWKTAAGTDDFYAMPDSAGVFELRSKKSAGRLYLHEARFDALKMQMESMNGVLFVK
ncbi:MAG: DUF4153 domain-containing protein [Saprospirales bacterium]|nr:DUF4153 domain-containing protein [Saprospirales bacterium]